MKNYSILIVDDEPHIIHSIFEILEGSGKEFTFFQANNGEIAYQAAKAKIPDLIISDWDMPIVDGIEFTKLLKENHATAHIPVIMSTGVMLTSENLKTALDAGAVDYIRKPIDPIELSARVNSMLMLSERMKEIKKQNQTIKQNNLFLKELNNTIQHPVFYYSPKGLVLGFNDSFKQIMPESMINEDNLHVYTLFIKDGVDIHYERDRVLLKENEPLSYQADLTFKDNSVHHCIFNKAVFHDNDNNVQGIICVITDITELKEAHKKMVDSQKKELAGITMRLVQTCELNEKIIEDISELSKFTNRKGNEHIRKIISNYKIISNNALWKDFELRFNEVYKDFYQNLNKKHPNLTTNERKLCAFLKLNMSTKEIASITFQNPRSIDMARYRLRKKMQLCESDSLISYISSF